jgi:hypothetical protein
MPCIPISAAALPVTCSHCFSELVLLASGLLQKLFIDTVFEAASGANTINSEAHIWFVQELGARYLVTRVMCHTMYLFGQNNPGSVCY